MASIAELTPRAERRSLIATIVDKLTRIAAAVIPYAVVALGLRLLMARVFFVSGQGKIDGLAVPITVFGRDAEFTVILPTGIKDTTFRLFETDYAGLPFSPTVAAYVFSYAEFLLPICLVLGFATRLSALALLLMTVLIQVYVAPGALWTVHVYWISILLVLMSVGPGAISIDRLLRYVYQQ